MIPARPLLLLFACGLVTLASSCGDQDVIRQYTVEKRTAESPPAAPKSSETVAPAPQHTAWSFKVTGPAEQVAEITAAFEQLVRSVQFGADSSPSWTLPEGWQERREQGLRFATLTAPTTPPLEMSVVPLASASSDSADLLKRNVDLWRTQLGLPAVEGTDWREKAAAANELTQFDAPAGKVSLVNVVGKDAKIGDARTLAALVPGPVPRPSEPAARPPVSPAGSDSKPFTYTLPEGWIERPAGQFQTAVFAVEGADPTLVISVSMARGSVLANVNRWCGQIQRPEFTADELKAAAVPVTVSGKPAESFVLEGPEQSILGVIVPEGASSWFFKAHGPKELAERERAKFDSFVQSVQFR